MRMVSWQGGLLTPTFSYQQHSWRLILRLQTYRSRVMIALRRGSDKKKVRLPGILELAMSHDSNRDPGERLSWLRMSRRPLVDEESFSVNPFSSASAAQYMIWARQRASAKFRNQLLLVQTLKLLSPIYWPLTATHCHVANERRLAFPLSEQHGAANGIIHPTLTCGMLEETTWSAPCCWSSF